MDATTKLYHEHPKTILFTAAAALRILLAVAFPALPDLLTGRVEISTPVNSFKRLQEGLFLYERGLDPYDGGIFHQAPLLLPLFSILPSTTTAIGQLISIALYTLLDILSADSIYEIAASGAATVSSLYVSPRRDLSWNPISVTAIYLFNPFTLLACLGRPTTVFATFFTLLSIRHAVDAKVTTAAFALAIASYMSLHPILLLPPIGLLCYDQLCEGSAGITAEASKTTSVSQRTKVSSSTFTLHYVTSFLGSLTLLFGLSRLLLPSSNFISSVYLTPLSLPSLTPNPGVWWYFFTEMFDAFRNFFLGVFWLHMLSYSVPLSLRLRKQPLAAVVAMLGITAIFQPYANVGETGAWLSVLCTLSHAFERKSPKPPSPFTRTDTALVSQQNRYTYPALAALLYATLLGPAFHHLWLYAGSGNANFFYAITLVWNLALLIIETDAVYAVLRDEWEQERPEGKGRDVRQI